MPTTRPLMRPAVWLLATLLGVAAPLAVAQQEPALTFNVIERSVAFSPDDIAAAAVVTDQDGRPAVEIRLRPEAARTFGELTAAHIGRRLQLVMGDEIVSTPIILAPILNGSMLIAGDLTQERAEAMAATLTAR
ncbi:MAG: hypothetical protein AAFW46_01510 [Pseudomonadota bacterium]